MVEDDAIHAKLTLRALDQCGLAHRTEHVTDGVEALDYIAAVNLFAGRQASLPKLILLDLGLPKMGGLQVLRQLKSDARTKNIPIVVLTARELSAEDMARLNGHVAATLSKALCRNCAGRLAPSEEIMSFRGLAPASGKRSNTCRSCFGIRIT